MWLRAKRVLTRFCYLTPNGLKLRLVQFYVHSCKFIDIKVNCDGFGVDNNRLTDDKDISLSDLLSLRPITEEDIFLSLAAKPLPPCPRWIVIGMKTHLWQLIMG